MATTTVRISLHDHERLRTGADAAGVKMRVALSEAITLWLNRHEVEERVEALDRRVAQLEQMAERGGYG